MLHAAAAAAAAGRSTIRSLQVSHVRRVIQNLPGWSLYLPLESRTVYA